MHCIQQKAAHCTRSCLYRHLQCFGFNILTNRRQYTSALSFAQYIHSKNSFFYQQLFSNSKLRMTPFINKQYINKDVMLMKFCCKSVNKGVHLYTRYLVPNTHRIDSFKEHFDGLVQDCSISITSAVEILQSCTKPSTWKSWILNKLVGNMTRRQYDY